MCFWLAASCFINLERDMRESVSCSLCPKPGCFVGEAATVPLWTSCCIHLQLGLSVIYGQSAAPRVFIEASQQLV